MVYRTDGYNADAKRTRPGPVVAVAPTQRPLTSRETAFRMMTGAPDSRMSWAESTAARVVQYARLFPEMPTALVAAGALQGWSPKKLKALYAESVRLQAKAEKEAKKDDRWGDPGFQWGDIGAAIRSGGDTAWRWGKQTSRFGLAAMQAPLDVANLGLRLGAAGIANLEEAMTPEGAPRRFTENWDTNVDVSTFDDSIQLVALAQNPSEAGDGLWVEGKVRERSIDAQQDQFSFRTGPFADKGFTIGRILADPAGAAPMRFQLWSDGAPGLVRNVYNANPIGQRLGWETDEDQIANILSGLIDARVAMKYDPGIAASRRVGQTVHNIVGTTGSRGYRVATEAEKEMGLVRGAWRNFVDKPTVEHGIRNTIVGKRLVTTLMNADTELAVARAFNWQGDYRMWRNFTDLTERTDVERELLRVFGALPAQAGGTIIERGARFRDLASANRVTKRASVEGASLTAAQRVERGLDDVRDYSMMARAKRNITFEAIRWGDRIGAKFVPTDDPTRLAVEFERVLDAAKIPYAKRVPIFRELVGNYQGPAQVYKARKLLDDVLYDAITQRRGWAPGSPGAQYLKEQLRFTQSALDDLGVYAIDALGKPLADTIVTIGGVTTRIGDGPIWANQLLNSSMMMPDYRVLRQQTSAYAKLLGRVADTGAGPRNVWNETILPRLDWVQNNAWKPLMLLRFGAMQRNIAEAQASIAANGGVSMFRDPEEWVALTLAASADELSAAASDFTGKKYQDILNNIVERHEYQEVLPASSRRNHDLKLAGTDKYFTSVPRSDSNYSTGWAQSIIRLHNDVVAREGARALLADDLDAAVAKLKDDFWEGPLTKQRLLLWNNEEVASDPAKQRLVQFLGTREGADAYIDQMIVNSASGLRAIAPTDELLEVIAKGKFQGYHVNMAYKATDVVDEATGKIVKNWSVDSDGHKLPLMERIYRAGRQGSASEMRAEKLLRRHLDEIKTRDQDIVLNRLEDPLLGTLGEDTISPEWVRFMDRAKNSRLGETQPKWIAWLFDMLYSTPSAKLSVHPGYVQAYTKRVEQLVPHMDAKSLRRARGYLPKQVYDKIDWTTLGAARKASGGGLTPEDVDRIAKQSAITWCRETFYDVVSNNKLNGFDVLRFLTPFGEAWADALGRWGRYLSRNPYIYKRGADMIEEGESVGFISENSDGELMMNIPFGRRITTLAQMLPGGPDKPVPVDLQSPLRGLNMIAQTLPGVGPLVSVPVSRLWPDDSMPQFVRDVVFPYGEPEIDSGLLEALLPGWAQRINTGMRWTTSPSAIREYNALVKRALDYYSSSGEYDLRKPAEAERAIADAKKAAKYMYLTRSMVQFMAPSPPAFKNLVQLKDGKLAELYVVAEDYRRMQQQYGEDAVWYFLRQYGRGMFTVMQPTSSPTGYGQVPTREFARWRDKHKDVYDKYRDVAGVFGPGYEWAGDGFDFDEYNRQIREGSRFSLLGAGRTTDFQEVIKLAHNRVGEWKYQQYLKELAIDNPDLTTDERSDLIAAARKEIQKMHPGWNDTTLLNQTRKIEIASAIRLLAGDDETTGMVDDPDARDMPGIKSLRTYLDARAEILALLDEDGMAISSRAGFPELPTSAESLPYRLELVRIAETLALTDPWFGRAWRELLSREGEMENVYEEMIEAGA